MKISERWLREWINPKLTQAELSHCLTMAGLEVESISPVAFPFSNVVVGQVLEINKHPEADRLQVCKVNIGTAEPLTIVCGAKNVTVGMKTPAALNGALLINDLKIKKSKLRGVMSEGMLCSAKELGLAEESEGLLILPEDAPLGLSVWDYLQLDDHIIEIAITPNRGDCLSVAGLTTEIAALTQTKPTPAIINSIKSTISDNLAVSLNAKEACSRYAGRVIRNIKANAVTPIWMQERLRRSGIRSINAIVDVMNYVMLEMGQPMHAFDLDKINKKIDVRFASEKAEKIILLNGEEVTLDPSVLVIADANQPLAIAGIMGGLASSVTLDTQHVFLESAYFSPASIARTTRKYGLNSDSSYRFERGIDPLLQHSAIARATNLILDIAGGEAGEIIDVTNEYLPKDKNISLRLSRINKLIGIDIDKNTVEFILNQLGFSFNTNSNSNSNTWEVNVPPRRSDINLEEDLIEEVIRLYGYDKLPLCQSKASLVMHSSPDNSEKKLSLAAMRTALCRLGYQEVVTYSFIDETLQQLFDPLKPAKKLLNPITAEMTVMRTMLLPGLINVFLYNHHRQQTRQRIFESGLCFTLDERQLLQQQPMLSGLISGMVQPPQWGEIPRPVDFFDIKGDIESLLSMTLASEQFEFKPGTHPALHPEQTALIYRNGKYVGFLGTLHPKLIQELELPAHIVVFELLLAPLEEAKLPQVTEISKFPEIRRDIAILVDRAVPVRTIQDTIRKVGGEWLQHVTVFDVYQGKGIPAGQKSIALGLTLQHPSRTLIDQEVADLMDKITTTLRENVAAELRG